MSWSPDEGLGVTIDDLLYGPEPEGDPWGDAQDHLQAAMMSFTISAAEAAAALMSFTISAAEVAAALQALVIPAIEEGDRVEVESGWASTPTRIVVRRVRRQPEGGLVVDGGS